MPSCSECRVLHKFNPGRPDCDSENPQFDGTCPRRNQKTNLPIARFLLLGNLFLKHHVLPMQGGVLDQDIRFIWTVIVLDIEIARETEASMKKAMKKMPRF